MFKFMLAAIVLIMSATIAPAMEPSFFDSTETKTDRTIHRWEVAVTKYHNGDHDYCPELSSRRCVLNQRDEFVASLIGKDKTTQLTEVNYYFNATRYVTDKRNWYKADYWASPDEFLMRGGDCEDYAIAKYFALKALGWSDDNLRVVVVRDTNFKSAHAILVVRHSGLYIVLDNNRRGIYDARNIDYYKAVYSVNESGVWFHSSNR